MEWIKIFLLNCYKFSPINCLNFFCSEFVVNVSTICIILEADMKPLVESLKLTITYNLGKISAFISFKVRVNLKKKIFFIIITSKYILRLQTSVKDIL